MRRKLELTKLNTGEYVPGKPGIVKDWHKWFAWYPIVTNDTHESVWLEYVWKKVTQDYPYNGFHGYGQHGWQVKTEYKEHL